MKILILGSYAPSLINFRGQLIQDLVAAGHDVTASAPGRDDAIAETLRRYGADYVPVSISRAQTNPAVDLLDLFRLWRLLRAIRPDLLFAYTIKPVVYGGLAARLAGVPKIFAMVTGLGYIFTDGRGWKRRLLRPLVAGLYRVSLAKTGAVIFQNEDDLREFKSRGIVGERHNLVRVHGSGVDLDHFAVTDPPAGPAVFLLIARLLVDKGIFDYVAAARLLRMRYPEATFRLLGPADTTPSAIPASDLEDWRAEGVIDYLGTAADVRPHLRACSVYVLPSYREGMPRTVLEAMATGRAIVTTDVPGCRDTVSPGENGFLVPPRDPEALAAAMERFVRSPALAARMGKIGRRIAEERYDVKRVNAAMLEAMGLA